MVYDIDFPKRKIKENSVGIWIPKDENISKKLPVFYNPLMRTNRDITILLLSQMQKLSLCDPLSGTGVRAIRFAKELRYKSIIANDINPRSVALIKKNMQMNNVDFEVSNMDANLLLLESNGFDFIDLDVFGSPNFMLDSALKRISRNGIIGVTATDTSSLSGTYPKACIRKYWAKPSRTEIMHEVGLRILIRKIQLIGAQYEKAMVPIYSFSKDHYLRVFLRCKKGKSAADEIMKQHKMINPGQSEFGPLWTGALWNKKLARQMSTKNRIIENQKFLTTIADEAQIESLFYYDLHKISKKEKLRFNPAKHDLIELIKKKGYKASSTHFSGSGIRSDISYDELMKLIKQNIK